MRWPELLLMLCASACGLILVKWALSSTGGQVNDYRDGVSVHSINLTQLILSAPVVSFYNIY